MKSIRSKYVLPIVLRGVLQIQRHHSHFRAMLLHEQALFARSVENFVRRAFFCFFDVR